MLAMLDVVVPLEGISLEELLFRGVKRWSGVTSTMLSFRGMVLWGLSGRHVMMDARTQGVVHYLVSW
jgi:hypothetical protein